eukprot:COSAG06_NODE_28807_length_567_cov_3.040598_2_plen_71_part_01
MIYLIITPEGDGGGGDSLRLISRWPSRAGGDPIHRVELQAADLRLRRCARLREPRRRDSARQRHVRSDVCE